LLDLSKFKIGIPKTLDLLRLW